MKLILLLVTSFITSIGLSQSNKTELNYNTKYYDAVNEWVALPSKETDSVNYYGFIYIDEQAGFTFHMDGSFNFINGNMSLVESLGETSNIKYRIPSRWTNVALIPKNQLAKLNLPEQPEWLQYYVETPPSTSYLKSIGYFYNHVGASHQALSSLLKAYQKDPHYKGLEFELAFAYNALQKFDKAIPILENALKNQPKNALFYRELGYALINTKQFEKAEKTYLKGIEISDKNSEKSEMAVNMSHTYFKLKNRKKFDEWAQITRKHAPKNSQFLLYINKFEEEWNKK